MNPVRVFKPALNQLTTKSKKRAAIPNEGWVITRNALEPSLTKMRGRPRLSDTGAARQAHNGRCARQKPVERIPVLFGLRKPPSFSRFIPFGKRQWQILLLLTYWLFIPTAYPFREIHGIVIWPLDCSSFVNAWTSFILAEYQWLCHYVMKLRTSVEH